MIHAISVCIIPYNDSLVFEKSLYSLIEALEFLDTFELMVLDNSTDKQHKDRNIEIIKNINNINILYYDEISSKKPAEAVSFFIKKARYDICLASADDVLFKKDSIKKAYEVITNHSGVAMVGFTSICYQSDFIIESQGSVISGCTTRVKDNNAGKRYILDTTRSLIKATHFRNSMMFKNTYGIDFDETFGFFYEESDFGLRLKKFGQIYCVSDAIIWHSLKIKKPTSNKRGVFNHIYNSIDKSGIYYLTRNRIIFSKKHGKNKFCGLFVIPYILAYFVLLLILRPSLLKSFFKGIRDGIFKQVKND